MMKSLFYYGEATVLTLKKFTGLILYVSNVLVQRLVRLDLVNVTLITTQWKRYQGIS